MARGYGEGPGDDRLVDLSLDTHTLIWWLTDASKLSRPALAAMLDHRNRVFVSAIVAWEIAIKASPGNLQSVPDFEFMLQANKFIGLPVSIAHAAAVEHLPHFHRDPFDRLLVAQALCEGLTIVTRDPLIQRYAAPCLMA